MTTPVITFVKPTADFKSAEKNYTVAFYLPQQFQVCSANHSLVGLAVLAHCLVVRVDWRSWCLQGDAPEPKDEEINIVDAPGATVYVKAS